jgi:hypothetical protein
MESAVTATVTCRTGLEAVDVLPFSCPVSALALQSDLAAVHARTECQFVVDFTFPSTGTSRVRVGSESAIPPFKGIS